MTDSVLEQAIKSWARSAPAKTTEVHADKAAFGHFWQRAGELLARLPAKPKRSPQEAAGAAEILAQARESRTRFMRAHAAAVYDALTSSRSRFVRVDELFFVLPGEAQVARIDEAASGHFANRMRFASPRAMPPLPVLGIPGWHPDTARESWYDDERHFQGLAPGS